MKREFKETVKGEIPPSEGKNRKERKIFKESDQKLCTNLSRRHSSVDNDNSFFF